MIPAATGGAFPGARAGDQAREKAAFAGNCIAVTFHPPVHQRHRLARARAGQAPAAGIQGIRRPSRRVRRDRKGRRVPPVLRRRNFLNRKVTGIGAALRSNPVRNQWHPARRGPTASPGVGLCRWPLLCFGAGGLRFRTLRAARTDRHGRRPIHSDQDNPLQLEPFTTIEFRSLNQCVTSTSRTDSSAPRASA